MFCEALSKIAEHASQTIKIRTFLIDIKVRYRPRYGTRSNASRN
jgi:hypothetical protein